MPNKLIMPLLNSSVYTNRYNKYRGVILLGTKRCSKCGKEKSLDDFYINSEKKGRYDESDPRLYKSNC